MSYKGKYRIFAILFAVLSFDALYGQCETAYNIEKWGDFNNWVVREIKESGIIGGNVRHLYEIANGDTIRGEVPYINPEGCIWSDSNVLATVKGVTKSSCTVFPEERDNGYCARLETRMEKIKVIGIINLNVIASGTVFLGKMLEPIKNTKDPQSKLDMGVPFTDRPKGITFDYKVIVGNNRLEASGFGSPKELHDNDYADCVVMLQKRWEDEQGNVYSKRVGTGYHRFTQTDTTWNNGYFLKINYGDISKEPYYEEYMGLIPFELSNYTINSKGESVPIREVEWAGTDDTPTHIIIRFSSSHGEAYVGDPANRLWIDNVKIAY